MENAGQKQMPFGELTIKDRFVYHGETFKKTAKSLAGDQKGYGFVFQPETAVEKIAQTERGDWTAGQ
jgi:hypothetical protein